jgi:hypothetical protein
MEPQYLGHLGAFHVEVEPHLEDLALLGRTRVERTLDISFPFCQPHHTTKTLKKESLDVTSLYLFPC